MTQIASVLIADDSFAFQSSLKRILEKNDFKVVGVANNGLSLLSLYRELQPDLVMIDFILQLLSGLETAKLLKTDHPQARVIMTSSIATKEAIEQSRDAGAIYCVLKPFDEETLIPIVKKYLKA